MNENIKPLVLNQVVIKQSHYYSLHYLRKRWLKGSWKTVKKHTNSNNLLEKPSKICTFHLHFLQLFHSWLFIHKCFYNKFSPLLRPPLGALDGPAELYPEVFDRPMHTFLPLTGLETAVVSSLKFSRMKLRYLFSPPSVSRLCWAEVTWSGL